MDKTCQVPEGCDRPIYGRGMCSKHWQQARRGTRDFILPSPRLPRTATPEERFWRKVDKTDTCWLWIGATSPTGYGYFGNMLAHHFLIGKPPPGFEVDHLCMVRNCVRPDHLEVVTRQENHARQRHHGPMRKDACGRGHPFDETNTNILPNGKRQCRTCNREAMRRWRGGGARQSVATCKHGHEFTPENTYIRRNGNRSCKTCAKEKMRRYRASRATMQEVKQSRM